MGASDSGERELHQGLIKLAAAYVHAVRGNPLGMAKNLRGARLRLSASTGTPEVGGDVDVAPLLDEIDSRLQRLESGQIAEPDLPLEPPAVPRRKR